MEELVGRDKRRLSLLEKAAEPELAFVAKAGWLWKRGKIQRKWVKRWFMIDSQKGTFKYVSKPGLRLDQSLHVLRGRTVGATLITSPVLRGSVKMYGFLAKDVLGRCRSFYCESQEEAAAWVWYLSSSQVYIQDRYTVDWHNIIGSGAYSDVVTGTETATGKKIAIKIVSKLACQRYFGLMDKEVQIMQMFRGSQPHLLTLREVFYSQDHIYIVTEYLAGGSLSDSTLPGSLKRSIPCSEQQAKPIIQQVLQALIQLHKLGISHCDVKPENLMFTSREADAEVKLIDYNSAVFFNDSNAPGGTPEYMAPELVTCSERQEGQGWGPGPDMWAVGIVLYWMLAGYTPFRDADIPSILCNIEDGRFKWPTGINLSAEVKHLITALLTLNPSQRPNASEVLGHPWLQDSREAALQADASHAVLSFGCLPGKLDGISRPAYVERSQSNRALYAAMNAALPRNLSVKVMSSERQINYGCGARASQPSIRECRAAAQAHRYSVDGRMSTSTETSRTSLGSEFTDATDPLDSCMSMHRLSLGSRKDSEKRSMELTTRRSSRKMADLFNKVAGEPALPFTTKSDTR